MENSEIKQVSLRIEKNLYEKIEKIAKQENRKISPQIEYMLKKYIEIKEN